jgi:hypothetical protein
MTNATQTNLALNKAATASSVQEGKYPAKLAVNGEPVSRWVSNWSDTEWIQVDLGSIQTFNTVKIAWEAAFGLAYNINVSNDAKMWTTVYKNTAGKGGVETLTLPVTSARYVRMQGVKRGSKYGYSIYELGVYNNDVLPTDCMFAPTSFWYQTIPANAPIDPNSANLNLDFLRQYKTHYNNVTINTWTYASPVYVVPADMPTVAVRFSDCQGKGYTPAGLLEQWSAVPIPSYAQPANGTDMEMTIYQPSTDTLWEFWQAKNVNGVWQACWGGRLQNASKCNGLWQNGFGTTATGLPFVGGQITAEELQRGEIRHAIGISLVDTEAHWKFSWPAQRSDGYNPNGAPNRIAEGQRFRLDPTINVDALNITPVAKIIAKAAQKYGFVVWDKAGSISLRASNPKSYTLVGKANPYDALFAGKAEYAVLNGFPWDKLQFLPVNYGKV